MKTTIYELLGMIKDGNIPQRIIFKDQIYEYVESAEDYYNEEHGYIFDVYVLKSILNDEVIILETTITYKFDKIEKIHHNFGLKWIECNINKEARNGIDDEINFLHNKINELIERINGI